MICPQNVRHILGAFFMDKRIKYSFEVKLWAVRSIAEGQESCLSAARKLGSRENTVQRWHWLYREHGEKGLTVRNGKYDGTFKLQVIRHMLKNRLSLVRTAVLFGIPQDSAVARWLKIYQAQGASGLLKETRGRKKPGMAKKTPKKISKNTDPAADKLEALQREVEYLRAENAFLKKLDALILQEKAAQKYPRQQKLSRN